MKRFLFALVILTLISCKDDKEPINPWDAERLVTLISNGADWEKEYNDANINTETKFISEYNGERTSKTLYPGTEDELVVIYNDSLPQELYWNKSGQWTTPYGTVGDPITILETANEAPISFYGLGYDLPGKVKIDSGKLANDNIMFAVRPTSDIIPTEFYSYNSFPLSSKEAQDLKLYITRVMYDLTKKRPEVQE